MIPDVGLWPFPHTCYRALTSILGHNPEWFLPLPAYSQHFHSGFMLGSQLTRIQISLFLPVLVKKELPFLRKRAPAILLSILFAIAQRIYH